MAKKQDIASIVRDILKNELYRLLEDVRYRLTVLDDAESGHLRIGSRQLNIASHQLDGYVVTDNAPVAGSISWSDINIVYKGTNYIIANGNTANKYIWWDFSATDKTILATSNTKPALEEDDVLVFVNDSGIHNTVVGKMTHGAVLKDATLSTNELANGAVTAAKILSSTITATQLADNAVSSGKIAAGAVTDTKIGSGAVTDAKIGTGAVTNAKLATDAVTDTKIASNAVTSAKIASGAVVAGKLATDAVATGNIATGAVTGAKIASTTITGDNIAGQTITGAKLQDGTISGTQIGAGTVSTSKLNTALHMIF